MMQNVGCLKENILLAAQHNEPLDEAVFSEVMFDKDTSGEVDVYKRQQ